MSVDVRQAVVATLKTIGELLVIDPQQVHDGGVQIVRVNGILRYVVVQ